MSETVEYSTLYIELDCLLDTRLSILHSLNPESAEKGLTDKSYFKRNIDRFIEVVPDEFKKRYEARTKDDLLNAQLTHMGQFVREFIILTESNRNTSPFQFYPKIVINTFPYELIDEECVPITQAIVAMTNGLCDVDVVYIPLNELTPIKVKNDYAIMVMYEYVKWIEIQAELENFKEVICPEVTLFGPAIYFKGLPTRAEQDMAIKEKITHFEAMELQASPLIGLKLLPIDRFCIALPGTK